MQRTLSLLLPALLPSWRFFQSIEPSPRVQWAILSDASEVPETWHDYRPRPRSVPWFVMLRRLIWNPRWNESLYMVSLAERMTDEPSAHTISEIRRLIHADLPEIHGGKLLQFRLIFVTRDNGEFARHLLYLSEPAPTRNAPS